MSTTSEFPILLFTVIKMALLDYKLQIKVLVTIFSYILKSKDALLALFKYVVGLDYTYDKVHLGDIQNSGIRPQLLQIISGGYLKFWY